MTTAFTFLLKLLFGAILVIATIASTVIISPFLIAGKLIGPQKSRYGYRNKT